MELSEKETEIPTKNSNPYRKLWARGTLHRWKSPKIRLNPYVETMNSVKFQNISSYDFGYCRNLVT